MNHLKKLIKICLPILIFAGIWLFVIFLMSLRLSNLLESNINEAFEFFFLILTCFISGYFICFVLKARLSLNHIYPELNQSLKNKYFLLVKFWFLFTILEVIASGGIPIFWLFLNNGKTYFDFGIPSVHGLLNALEMTLGILSFYIYKKYKEKKYLYLTTFFIIWNVLIISRQVIMVMLIEMAFIYFLMSDKKLKILRNICIYSLIVVFLFGIVGDLRSGANNFLELAQPSENWPNWLPSGFLWVYVYLTTPINNLLFNFQYDIENYHFLFPNTMSLLFPSFIRNFIYNQQDTVSGNLVTQAFNVSSAFMSSYMDMGKVGIGIFSFLIGNISYLSWWSYGPKRIFFQAITFQCIILTVFYNHFFYLPVAFQYFWFFIFFAKFKNESREISNT